MPNLFSPRSAASASLASTSQHLWQRSRRSIALAFVSLALLTAPIPSQAQIAGDATLGTQVNGDITAPCTGFCIITDGSPRGRNLFHSFQRFSLPSGDFARFVTTPAIQNVIVRVTEQGSDFISNINGTIATSNPANFFLLNPNGILFGPSAALNIGGSFLATTADRMQFQDGTLLGAHDPNPLLTISVPTGLQFGRNIASIQVDQAFLFVTTGQTVALIGGDMVFTSAFLNAPDGRVDIGSVAGEGFVRFTQVSRGWAFGYGEIQQFGNIKLSDTFIRASGAPSGDIQIQAQNLTLTDDTRIFTQTTAGDTAGGRIIIRATGTFDAGTDSFISTTNISSGKGGDMLLEVGTLTLGKNARVNAEGFLGAGGNIILRATDTINLSNTSRLSTASLDGIIGGNLSIETGNLNLIGNAIIDTGSFSGGSGNLTIKARGAIGLREASTLSTFSQLGVGGDIDIETRILTLQEGSQIFTVSFGDKPSGNVKINASESIEISGISNRTIPQPSGIITQAAGSGKAGNIIIQTGELIVKDGGKIAASGLFGSNGQGGDIDIQANEIKLTGSVNVFARSAIETRADGFGGAGRIAIKTRTLAVQDGSQISASTLGNGAGGKINIRADQLEVSGRTSSGLVSEITAQTAGFGNQKAGDIVINAQNLFLNRHGRINVRSQQQGDAGDIAIIADSISLGDQGQIIAQTDSGQGGNVEIAATDLFLLGGSQISAKTFGSGNSGTLTINASKLIHLSGLSMDRTPSGLFASTEGSGTAGSIQLTTKQLNVRNFAGVNVSSEGTGAAGNLEVNADSILLDNHGRLTASTFSGNGGNILLNVKDLLLLRNQSFISTSAGTAQAGGEGGNITIAAPKGFIIGVKSENSDITANAFTGSGGRVNITAQGIYGLQFRPRLTEFSDITASSEFGLQGSVILNTPDVDPSRGLEELPVVLADPSRLIVQTCPRGAGSRQIGTFVVTGRGSLPPSPTDLFPGSISSKPLATLEEDRGDREVTSSSLAPSSPPASSSHSPIVEANAWIRDADGSIYLVAATPVEGSPRQFWLTLPCSQKSEF
ncbi:MAG: S-layer family protein [Leptolyngbyaceae cyanobacterium RU_5_1]|nr:S-layer family protein [Leptolyngbyaceae cyanobacterium RU_5_1]